MEQNLVDAEISSADIESINGSVLAIKSKLPFKVSLTAEEKSALYKLGESFAPFVEKAEWTVNTYPQIMPGTFNINQFKKDLKLRRDMAPINSSIQSLAKIIDDTYTAVGSDIINNVMEIYAFAKANEDKIPGLKPIVDEMKSFFPKRKRVVPDEKK